MHNTAKKILLVMGMSALCLLTEAQVRFPLDEASAFPGAIVMPGAVGNAVRLNGYTSFATKQYAASALSTLQQTISLWCAIETYPMMNAAEAELAYTSIIETIDDNAHSGFAVRLSSQGHLRFECYSSGWKQTVDAEGLLPTYQWNHIVVTLDATARQIRLYNNGVLLGEGRTMNELSGGSGTMLIGKDSSSKFFSSFRLNTFNGLIDDIRIDNRIWSEDEISALPQNEADLIFPTDAFYANTLRPHFHGMPMMGWTNETHGLIRHNGKYHLFFQKNPNGPYMARLNWGHLVSEDLCGWEEMPIAVAPSETYDIKGCWSGCVFADQQLTAGNPWIAYTGVDNARATIDFATPTDNQLLAWDKDATNPRINGRPAGLSDDFRDPYFFRNGDNAYLIVGSAKDGVGVATLHRFEQNGRLSNTGELFFQGTNAATCGTFFEMPNLTRMGNKWLFTATPLGSNVGVRTIYWVGTIGANGTFVPDNTTPKTVELTGMARDGYGLLSPSICQVDGKTIALGIVPDKLPSSDNSSMGWAHSYSLPREWTLAEDGSLIQKPFSGLTALRVDTAFSAPTLNGGVTSVQVGNPMQVEMEATFTIGSDNCGFNLLDGKLMVTYEPSTNRIVVNMTGLQRKANDTGVFDGVYASSLPEQFHAGDQLKLHLYFDHSMLDLFVADKWATSIRLFPSTLPTISGVEIHHPQTTFNVAVYNLETTVSPKTYPLVAPEADQPGGNVAIETVEGETSTFSKGCYTIMGQQIAPEQMQSGHIYILNGHKHIMP